MNVHLEEGPNVLPGDLRSKEPFGKGAVTLNPWTAFWMSHAENVVFPHRTLTPPVTWRLETVQKVAVDVIPWGEGRGIPNGRASCGRALGKPGSRRHCTLLDWTHRLPVAPGPRFTTRGNEGNQISNGNLLFSRFLYWQLKFFYGDVSNWSHLRARGPSFRAERLSDRAPSFDIGPQAREGGGLYQNYAIYAIFEPQKYIMCVSPLNDCVLLTFA
jgi:hypothetical protein